MADRRNSPDGGPSPRPPADLPADPGRFWSAGVDLDELASPSDVATTPALKKLGPLPLARGSFPLLGFLATVYEQIAGHVEQALGDETDATGS
jgi:hypothetical protein